MRWSEKDLENYNKKKRGNSCTVQAVSKPLSLDDILKTDEEGNTHIIIPGSPVTKKNHGNIVSYGEVCSKCGRGKYSRLVPSDAYKKYRNDTKPYFDTIQSRTGTISTPVNLKCLFYCGKRYKSDLAGYLQCIQDILVESAILIDDNRDIVASVDGSRVLYDKDNPRTEIIISPVRDYNQWAQKQ